MKIQIQSVHFDADVKLLNFIEKKLNKLDTFYDRVIDATVFLRLDKNDHKENKIVEVKINVPGNVIFAKAQRNTFETATDEVLDMLKRQITKYKEKQMNH